ncbi:MAG TPA: hypothetical protein VKI19_14595 [Acidimicrobiales bacterium]|nr:hypothetical protein [Acidimicrobiales bacterium]
MFVTTHVLAGAVIGRVLAGHPVAAFAAGVVSHFAMDACPHYGDDAVEIGDPEFIRVARCDGCAGLAAMAVGAGLAPRPARRAGLAGMLGGAIVDSDKPMEYFFGWNPWPEAWNRFHKRVQNQEPHRLPHELLIAAALAALVWQVVPERRVR